MTHSRSSSHHKLLLSLLNDIPPSPVKQAPKSTLPKVVPATCTAGYVSMRGVCHTIHIEEQIQRSHPSLLNTFPTAYPPSSKAAPTNPPDRLPELLLARTHTKRTPPSPPKMTHDSNILLMSFTPLTNVLHVRQVDSLHSAPWFVRIRRCFHGGGWMNCCATSLSSCMSDGGKRATEDWGGEHVDGRMEDGRRRRNAELRSKSDE